MFFFTFGVFIASRLHKIVPVATKAVWIPTISWVCITQRAGVGWAFSRIVLAEVEAVLKIVHTDVPNNPLILPRMSTRH